MRSTAPPSTPACDHLRALGEWNSAWDQLYDMDPVYTERFMSMLSHAMYSGDLDPKTREFIAIAIDASCTHMYSPGVKRHVRKALELGASPREILAVLEMVSVLGIHSVALGVPILAEEMQRAADASRKDV